MPANSRSYNNTKGGHASAWDDEKDIATIEFFLGSCMIETVHNLISAHTHTHTRRKTWQRTWPVQWRYEWQNNLTLCIPSLFNYLPTLWSSRKFKNLSYHHFIEHVLSSSLRQVNDNMNNKSIIWSTNQIWTEKAHQLPVRYIKVEHTKENTYFFSSIDALTYNKLSHS